PALAQPGRALGAHPERAREAPQLVLGGRDEVGAAEPEELDAVLERAQEPVADPEPGRVLASHVPAGGELAERGERAAAADRLVGATVHELEELDRELDVAQAALAQLELAVRLRSGHVVLDAAAHRLRVLDEVLPARRGPHERRDRVLVRTPQVSVPRDRARLEQRLELPRLGPALV